MYFFNRYFDAKEVWGSLGSIYSLLQQQVQEAGFPTTYTYFTETGYRLDHLSAYDWIEQYVEGGHGTALGHMLDGACRGYFGGYEGVRQGPVHFAGEHCSTSWQGFMEGGASEGARAAREILQDYGIR